VHNLTIGNLTVRADPSVRTAASISIEESARPLSELDARRAAPALASLERAGVMRSEGELVPILVDPHCEATDLPLTSLRGLPAGTAHEDRRYRGLGR
jgi:hypothetical protein